MVSFPPAKFESMTDGFQPEASSLLDCEMKCFYNLFHFMYRQSKENALHLSLKEIKADANHKWTGVYNHERMMVALNQRIQKSGYRLLESRRSEGMDLRKMREIVISSGKSPAIIGVGYDYFKDQGFKIKAEAKEPADHSIIVLDINWEDQLALIYDPMENFICKRRGNTFRREYPLARLSTHWNGARVEQAWIAWLEKTVIQTDLRGKW